MRIWVRRHIKRVAVLGAGRMGSCLACHFANAGAQVLLLDLPQVGDVHKNAAVQRQLQATLQASPPALYSTSFGVRIATGNFEEDIAKIKDCDWILEAVVEDVEAKRSLLAQVDRHRRADSIVSSNTSSIPLHGLAAGRSDSFRAHFCGTHFFNPPRYLRLLELIPTPETNQELVDFLLHYGSMHLGKEVVLCKDTPAFVANRIGIYGMLSIIRAGQDLGFSFAEVDVLTGTLIGRPKSATFRTLDVVGLDVMGKVVRFLHGALKDDPQRARFQLPAFMEVLEKKGWWGEKAGQGFYKKTKKDGKTEILQWDVERHTYRPYESPRFEAVKGAQAVRALEERLPMLSAASGAVGTFYRRTFHDIFSYAAQCVPSVADTFHTIDRALCAGFGWAFGPFQTWDALGFLPTLSAMQKADVALADWLQDMQQSGATSFYSYKGGKPMHYDVPSKKERPLPRQDGVLCLAAHKEQVVWSDPGATLYDVGDGVLQLAFHTKMNTLNAHVMEGLDRALQLATEQFCGLVIANEAEHFSAGADLSLVYAHAAEQEYDEIDWMIRRFQQFVMRLRTAPLPVVAGVRGMVLGGGCELSLHTDLVVAHAETYMGLVEAGVGLIPAGGGTKEMARRLSLSLQEGDPVLNRLLRVFKLIATAKVSQSAHEAVSWGFMGAADPIARHASHVAQYAKEEVLRLHRRGYQPAHPAHDIKVQGRAGIAFLETVITNMVYGHYASPHDAKVAQRLSHVMNGGMLPAPTEVSASYLLDLEREAFLSLCGEPKTVERMHSLLFKKKTLRN